MRTPADNEADRVDYLAFLDEYGFTEEWVHRHVQNLDDQVPMPSDIDAAYLGPSTLHGMGMFASRHIPVGALIAPARIGIKRTPVGRYTNHAMQPNCIFVAFSQACIYLIAARNIVEDEELTVDYRQAGRVNGSEHGRISDEPLTCASEQRREHD